MRARDTLQRFSFEAFAVRGQIVHLDDSWQEVLRRHRYPDAVSAELGRVLAASALLTSTLKFDGKMTLQLQGAGPLGLLVAQCTSQLELRGLARWKDPLPETDFAGLVGDGRLVITIQSDKRRQPYQGVVPVSGGSIDECLTRYFETSEQVPTQIWLDANRETAAGLLLQRMPGAVSSDDDWNRVRLMAETLTGTELRELAHRELLRRLYSEDDLRLFDSRAVRFSCSCSSSRIETVLRSLGEAELESILKERGSVEVDCEFCNRQRRFDRVDVARLLQGGEPDPSGSVH